MIVLTLIVGGATRLTESGLSIVEWKPVSGVLPPLSDGAWQAEFENYKAIPQYRELNRGMSLDAVQDDLLVGMGAPDAGAHHGRRISTAIFVLPLARRDSAAVARAALADLWRRRVARPCRLVDGCIRAVRVKLTSVSQYRLAFHLTLASAIYAAVLWTSQQVLPRRADCLKAPRAQWRAAHRRAGAVSNLSRRVGRRPRRRHDFNTWPDIDGGLIPIGETACGSRRRGGAICSRTRSPCSSTIGCSPTRYGCWRGCTRLTHARRVNAAGPRCCCGWR